MEELLNFTNLLENVLDGNDIPYTVIDALDFKKRVDIVNVKLNNEYNQVLHG